MARGTYCKVVLIGNVGADPDVRYTPSGNPVANLSVATDESYKDRQTGQMVPKSEWHRVVVFGKIAEIVQQYVKKGDKVLVEGRLETRKWKDKAQVDRYSTEIIVDQRGIMEMLGGGKNKAQSQSARPAAPSQAGNGGNTPPPADPAEYGNVPHDDFENWDDDRPF